MTSQQSVPSQKPHGRSISNEALYINQRRWNDTALWNKAFDAELQLEFFLDDDNTALLLGAYHDSKGGYEVLDLPENIYSGMSADLQEQIRDYYSWRFAAPPRSESVMPGRSKISVTLVGGLDI